MRLNLRISVQFPGSQVLGFFTFSPTINAYCCSGVHDSGIKLFIQYLTAYFFTSSLRDIHSIKTHSLKTSSINLSARNLSFVFLSSISGSENPQTCPEATHTCGFMRIAASRRTISGRRWTNSRIQRFLRFSFIREPRGP